MSSFLKTLLWAVPLVAGLSGCESAAMLLIGANPFPPPRASHAEWKASADRLNELCDRYAALTIYHHVGPIRALAFKGSAPSDRDDDWRTSFRDPTLADPFFYTRYPSYHSEWQDGQGWILSYGTAVRLGEVEKPDGRYVARNWGMDGHWSTERDKPRSEADYYFTWQAFPLTQADHRLHLGGGTVKLYGKQEGLLAEMTGFAMAQLPFTSWTENLECSQVRQIGTFSMATLVQRQMDVSLFSTKTKIIDLDQP